MTTPGTQPPPAGFWKIRHLAIVLGVLVLLVMLMLRGCGSDDAGEEIAGKEGMPRQAIVVQIPASQWPPVQQQVPVQPAPPQQPGYGYMPQQAVQPQAPVADGGNPWAVQAPRSYEYRPSAGAQQWGQTQQRPSPQYVPPAAGARYRPLEEDNNSTRAAPRPAAPPVQGYRPPAPYDRLSGSSFGESGQAYPYPYGGAYPGSYYGYGVPGATNPYMPGYPVVPGAGWPGVW